MRLITQTYEILGTPKSLNEAWEFVAKAARNCYQSEKTRLDESEEAFCKRILLKHPEDLECDHMSPFEFGVVYLSYESDKSGNPLLKYEDNPYSRCTATRVGNSITRLVTTNLRVIIEHGWEDDLKYAGPPTKWHMKACCFKFDTSIHVYKDLTRHEGALSFAIESTR